MCTMKILDDARHRRLLLLVLWAAAALYVLQYLPRGWIAHDEGTIGQSAERVLGGELPHRDFDDPYTGGLAWVNAGAMRIFGVNLLAPRLMLYLVFLGWVPALWGIARRVAPPAAALLFVALAIAWSVPAYSVALPSWYNTFFATFGVLALMKWLEEPRARWLAVAGAMGGLSILFKIVGLYYVAAGLLFLAYHEQHASRTRRAVAGDGVIGPFGVALMALVGCFLALVSLTVGGEHHARQLVTWVLPIAAVCALVVREELAWRHEAFAARLRRLVAGALPFLGGVAVPVALFLLPYLVTGSVGALVDDVLVKPRRRAAFAHQPPPALRELLGGVPVLLLVLLPARWWRARRRAAVAIAGLLLAALLVVARDRLPFFISWAMLSSLLPVLGVCGAIVAARHADDSRAAQQRFLLLAAATLCALVQYPFASRIYYLYSLPLFALAWLATLVAPGTARAGEEGGAEPAPSRAPAATGSLLLAGYFLGFALWAIHPGFIWNMGTVGRRFRPDVQNILLPPPRGGITVGPGAYAVYAATIDFVRGKAHGEYVYAAPDAPEV
ncbi:MAG TPA: glycosyltransferase family 39 protein, partial [Gemmatimonadaceae bacterium]